MHQREISKTWCCTEISKKKCLIGLLWQKKKKKHYMVYVFSSEYVFTFNTYYIHIRVESLVTKFLLFICKF